MSLGFGMSPPCSRMCTHLQAMSDCTPVYPMRTEIKQPTSWRVPLFHSSEPPPWFSQGFHDPLNPAWSSFLASSSLSIRQVLYAGCWDTSKAQSLTSQCREMWEEMWWCDNRVLWSSERCTWPRVENWERPPGVEQSWRENRSCLGRKAELEDNRRKQNKIHMCFSSHTRKWKLKGWNIRVLHKDQERGWGDREVWKGLWPQSVDRLHVYWTEWISFSKWKQTSRNMWQSQFHRTKDETNSSVVTENRSGATWRWGPQELWGLTVHREVQRNLGRLGLPSGHADGLESVDMSQPTSGPRLVSNLFNVSPAWSLRRRLETNPNPPGSVCGIGELPPSPCCFLVRVTRMVRAGSQWGAKGR